VTGIKFLKGYGISIRQKNNQVYLTDGADPFTGKRDTESYYITQFPYEKIVLCGDGYISTKAIALLLQNNVHLIQVDTQGNLITSMSTPAQSPVMTKWRMGQYQTFSNHTKVHKLRLYFQELKLSSQIRLFEYLLGDSKKSIKSNSRLGHTARILKSNYLKLKQSKTHNQIDRIEQESAIVYFKQFAQLIPERFDYSTRYNGVWSNQSKENATNVINALLNYGYSVLASDIAKYVHVFGLDPYYGFYHKTRYFMALVYDIIEPFRVLVDSTVLQMANSDYYPAGRINKKLYYNTNKGFVLLDKKLIAMFLERLQITMNKKRPYHISKGRRSEKLANNKSHAQESTIIREEVRTLADYCIGKSKIFYYSQ